MNTRLKIFLLTALCSSSIGQLYASSAYAGSTREQKLARLAQLEAEQTQADQDAAAQEVVDQAEQARLAELLKANKIDSTTQAEILRTQQEAQAADRALATKDAEIALLKARAEADSTSREAELQATIKMFEAKRAAEGRQKSAESANAEDRIARMRREDKAARIRDEEDADRRAEEREERRKQSDLKWSSINKGIEAGTTGLTFAMQAGIDKMRDDREAAREIAAAKRETELAKIKAGAIIDSVKPAVNSNPAIAILDTKAEKVQKRVDALEDSISRTIAAINRLIPGYVPVKKRYDAAAKAYNGTWFGVHGAITAEYNAAKKAYDEKIAKKSNEIMRANVSYDQLEGLEENLELAKEELKGIDDQREKLIDRAARSR